MQRLSRGKMWENVPDVILVANLEPRVGIGPDGLLVESRRHQPIQKNKNTHCFNCSWSILGQQTQR